MGYNLGSFNWWDFFDILLIFMFLVVDVFCKLFVENEDFIDLYNFILGCLCFLWWFGLWCLYYVLFFWMVDVVGFVELK